MNRFLIVAGLLFYVQNGVLSQSLEKRTVALPFTKVVLDDLSFFEKPSRNWQIVGNVFADRTREQSLESTPGRGILANLSDSENRGHLFSKFEHGDLELELDVLMPAGSNSGVYFQGRYEVQLMDSWGKSLPRYADMGGIYQRTDTVTNKGYEGHAPLVNASKAPGLWQHLRILFRAPRFDAQGRKTANARFEKIYLNGILIQDGVEVSGPTRSGAFKDERPTGPIMIQGNHGRVAFRNIGYKLYGNQRVQLEGLTMQEFRSPGETLVKFVGQSPVAQSGTDSVSYLSATQKEIFLLQYDGRMSFPVAGNYLFKMHTGGGGLLVIGPDTLLLQDGVHGFEEEVSAFYKAEAGVVPFRLIYNKPIGWRKGLTLEVEGPDMALHGLHSKGSVFVEAPVEAILLNPTSSQAVLQRTFMEDGAEKKTHCISIGTPQKINYTIDLETGSLFQLWYGGFLEVTSMWHRRGNQQLGIPLGPVIRFPGGADIWKSAGAQSSRSKEEVKFIEYRLDSKGLPTFFYTMQGLTLEEKLVPSDTERRLTRRVKLTASVPYTYRLASGSTIELLPDGSYGVNGKEYYLILQPSVVKPVIRQSERGQELVIRGNGKGKQELVYSLVW